MCTKRHGSSPFEGFKRCRGDSGFKKVGEMRGMGEGPVWLVIGVAASLLPVCVLVNCIVPEPYMDEIFHIPQAQQYCKGNFYDWDPLITTFPGLYILSLAYMRVLLPVAEVFGAASSLPDLCSTAILRSFNMVLSGVCSLLFLAIERHLEPKKSEKRVTLKALLLSQYPLHWFFATLYYTDVGSTTAVMAMHLAGLKQAYWISSLFAAVAIMFRQTNVVWTIFVTFVGVLDFLKRPVDSKIKEAREEDSQGTAVSGESPGRFSQKADGLQYSSILRKRVAGNPEAESTDQHTNPQRNITESLENEGILAEVLKLANLVWRRRLKLLWRFGPLFSVILAFAAFVFYNGSIVVGAKDAHKVSPHFAQILYFGLVSSAAMAPVHFSPTRFAHALWVLKRPQAWVYIFFGFAFAFVCVHYFSYEHPYLLADNRHYTFYLWKDVIRAHWSARYCLIPFYVYSWWSLLHSLGKSEGKLWLLVFCVGIAAVLVPAPLVEFRYYTVPFYLIALHTRIPNDKETGVTSLLAVAYTGVNILTMYMFLLRPFQWMHEPEGVQRFIW